MSWLDHLMERHGRLKLAQDATMVQDQRAYLADGRAANRAYQRTFLGPEFPGAGQTATEAEEMIVGDVHTQHYHPAPAPPSGSVLPKLLLAAGLLATGAGLPAAAWIVAEAIRNRPVPTPVAAPAHDPPSPLGFRLELVDPAAPSP